MHFSTIYGVDGRQNSHYVGVVGSDGTPPLDEKGSWYDYGLSQHCPAAVSGNELVIGTGVGTLGSDGLGGSEHFRVYESEDLPTAA